MIQSMTAYARNESQTELGILSCEMRGVNHRYLDISLRMPEEIRVLEPRIREKIGQTVKRGKLEVSLRLQASSGEMRPIHINSETLKQLQQGAEQLLQATPDLLQPTWLELLRWPGLLSDEKVNEDKMSTSVLAMLEACLADLVLSRQSEGQKLQQIIQQRLTSMLAIIDDVEKKLPDIQKLHRQKLQTRLDEIKGEIDQNRLEQELLFLAQRMDVDEELQRLRVHVAAIEQTFQRNEPVGRRLDFLMQELNREANTLGSKSISAESSNASVEMKVLIEQMREQVQNIE